MNLYCIKIYLKMEKKQQEQKYLVFNLKLIIMLTFILNLKK